VTWAPDLQVYLSRPLQFFSAPAEPCSVLTRGLAALRVARPGGQRIRRIWGPPGRTLGRRGVPAEGGSLEVAHLQCHRRGSLVCDQSHQTTGPGRRASHWHRPLANSPTCRTLERAHIPLGGEDMTGPLHPTLAPGHRTCTCGSIIGSNFEGRSLELGSAVQGAAPAPYGFGTSVWPLSLFPQQRAELSGFTMPHVWYWPAASEAQPPLTAGTVVWP
jgi:hypothetical protein